MLRRIRYGILVVTFSVLTAGPINIVLRSLLKPISALLPNMFSNKFPVVGNVHVDLPGARPLILKSKGGDTIASRMYWKGLRGHEPETISIFRDLLSDTRVVFDVGASTGLFSLIAGADGEDREVHAFEPVPKTCRYLLRNIAANGLQNINTVQACVSNFDGEQTLYLNKSPALPLTTSTMEGYRETSESIMAPAVKLDTYVAENHIQSVDLIKIDAEGSDDKVLEGAASVLEKYKPFVICEVLYDHTDKLIQGILDGTGYRYFFIKNDGLVECKEIVGDPEWKFRNYLFIHGDRWPRGIVRELIDRSSEMVAKS